MEWHNAKTLCYTYRDLLELRLWNVPFQLKFLHLCKSQIKFYHIFPEKPEYFVGKEAANGAQPIRVFWCQQLFSTCTLQNINPLFFYHFSFNLTKREKRKGRTFLKKMQKKKRILREVTLSSLEYQPSYGYLIKG